MLGVYGRWKQVSFIFFALQLLGQLTAGGADSVIDTSDCPTATTFSIQVTINNCTIRDLQDDKRLPQLQTISSLRIANSHLPQLQNNSFLYLRKLTVLVLRQNGISFLSSGTFMPTQKLQILDLGANSISELPDTIFQPLTQLKRLYLDNNRLKSLQSLDYLPSLAFLDVSCNDVPDGLEKFPTMVNLVTLIAQNAGIDILTNSAFDYLPKLCELDLTENKLSYQDIISIVENISPVTARILKLGNQKSDNTQKTSAVQSIQTSTSIKEVTYLDLSRTQISPCDQNILEKYKHLKTLILSSNNLNVIPDCIQNSSVENLNLSSNDISTWKKEANFLNLKYLNLDRNLITYVSDTDIFRPFPNLKNLSMNRNSITHLGPYVFHHLAKLEFLDLSQNDLDVIENYTLAGLTSLNTLHIYNNNIKIYPNNRPFEKLYNLTTLIFHHNSLCEIWSWVLPDQINLRILDMSQNKIECWKERAFTTNKNLEVVYLNNNEIRQFTTVMLEELSEPHFQTVDISGNVFDCDDCSMENLVKWFDFMNGDGSNEAALCSANRSDCGLYRNVVCNNGDAKPIVVDYTTLELKKNCHESDSENHRDLLAISISILGTAVFICVLFIVLYRLRWYVKYYWYLYFGKYCLRAKRKESATHTYSAYISYSESDRLWLQNTFLPSLENQTTNFHFYVLERDFEPGRYIIENILNGMENSKCFVALLSKDYLRNSWRVWEFNWAVCRLVADQFTNCPAVMVLNLGNVKETEMTSTMRSVLHTQAHFKWPQEGLKQKLLWEKLQLSLAKHCIRQNNVRALEDQNTRL